MRRLFSILFICCSPFFALAQGDDYAQVLSPTAAELGKYGKIPVSYFNGLPNVSVPLTELRAKDYTLPIYLTYHAGGNKPEQHPGWVGQGWALHAGGCISRIVRGKKDEKTIDEYRSEINGYGVQSHPDIPATPTDEYFSMGMNPVNHSFERINPLPGLDWYNVQHFPQRKAKIYFVYFPNSKNFYRLAYPNKLATKHNLFSKYR